jgi:dihydroorotate dehydrogenase (fumarate)
MLQTKLKTSNRKYNNLKDESSSRILKNPFINASGCYCQTTDELTSLYNSTSGAMITKTATEDPRKGNPEPRYYHNDALSINSMGLPNNSIKYYLKYYFEQWKGSLTDGTKKIQFENKLKLISLGGLSLSENVEMLRLCLLYYYNSLTMIDGIEINFSCPNLIGHPQLGYDFVNMEKYLKTLLDYLTDFEILVKSEYALGKRTFLQKPLLIGLKLPPYFDISHFKTVSDIIKNYSRINFLTCINSVGNGLVIDTETESTVIKPKDGFGGLGGSIIKPTALANVHQFYRLLGDRLFIVGCGGISTGEDAFHHILAGASLISIGTQLMREGLETFSRIENELIEIMKQKNYISIDEFRGKLKYIE